MADLKVDDQPAFFKAELTAAEPSLARIAFSGTLSAGTDDRSLAVTRFRQTSCQRHLAGYPIRLSYLKAGF